ncbi:hypothetical protein Mapa_011201 [Marchantia paleacea]|nr:hypothetical protein Mapa_011201 [Marchantia paleacea]
MGGTAQFLIFIMIIILIKESFAKAANLEVTPKTLHKSGDKIKLSLTGVAQPFELDWLGWYNPPDSDHNFFLGYKPLFTCEGFRESGTCELDIPLVNMRAPYQFRAFRGKAVNVTDGTPVDEDGDPLPSTQELLAVSPNVQFRNYNEPTQIHLALTSDSKEMRVMFVTRDLTTSFVKYGRTRSSLQAISETQMETYSQTDMCHAPANSSSGWRNPGVIHDAVMKNLVQGKRYYYQVGSDAGGWSDTYSFRMTKEDADETHALLFGDMGTTAPYKTYKRLQPESETTIRLMESDIKELEHTAVYISHIGDISYARGYAWLWDEFFHRIQPVASQAPYHVCIGNHEYDWPQQPWKPDWASKIYGTDGGGECGVPYSVRFNMPGNSTLPNSSTKIATRNLYYAHAVGVVHFLYISTETNFLPGSDQLAFIETNLKSVDRTKTPFVMVLGHRPMYTTSKDTKGGALRAKMIEHIEPLLVRYNVSLVLWGHVHKYERTCAIQNYTCADPAESTTLPVHVVIGMGGQDYQVPWEPRPQYPDSPVFPQKEWSLFRSSEFGYVRLHATRSVLTLKYVGNHDGQIHDVLKISLEGEEDDDRQFPGWFWALLAIAAVVASVVALGSLVYMQTLGSLQRYWRLGEWTAPKSPYV